MDEAAARRGSAPTSGAVLPQKRSQPRRRGASPPARRGSPHPHRAKLEILVQIPTGWITSSSPAAGGDRPIGETTRVHLANLRRKPEPDPQDPVIFDDHRARQVSPPLIGDERLDQRNPPVPLVLPLPARLDSRKPSARALSALQPRRRRRRQPPPSRPDQGRLRGLVVPGHQHGGLVRPDRPADEGGGEVGVERLENAG